MRSAGWSTKLTEDLSLDCTAEPQGEGIIGSVASAVKRRIPGSDSVAVVYPATLYSYTTSQAAGARAMSQMVSSYTASCPDTKIVLMGYSQGAHVVGDTLVGASSTFGGSGVTATTSKNSKSHVGTSLDKPGAV